MRYPAFFSPIAWGIGQHVGIIRQAGLLGLGMVLAGCASQRSPLPPDVHATDHGAIGATEGPAWHDGFIYFTGRKAINRLGPDGTDHGFPRPAGGWRPERTGVRPRRGVCSPAKPRAGG